MKLRLLGLCAALFFLYACEFGTAPGGGGTGGEGLTGILVDAQGVGVAGAKVRVYPSVGLLAKGADVLIAKADSTTTNADGRFRFKDLPDGRYNLEASVKRNDTVLSVFVRGIDFVKKLDLGKDTLEAGGSLSLKVVDALGASVAGATCAIPGSSWSRVSDTAGGCTLTGVARGAHSVSITVNGETTNTEAVTVVAGGSVQMGTLNVTSSGAGNFIPASWSLTSLQGYVYSVPPDLELQSEGYYGIDSWGASYRAPSLTLSLISGMVPAQALPDSFPEYTEERWTLDSMAMGVEGAILVTYRVPDSLKSRYPGTNFMAALFVTFGSATEFPDAFPLSIALCENHAALARVRTILRSFRVWKGPGPAPVPSPLKPVLLDPKPAASGVHSIPALSWRNDAGSTLTSYYRIQVATDSAFVSKVYQDSAWQGSPFVDTLKQYTTPLSASSLYYWRVVAVGPGGSTSSEIRSFTTRSLNKF